MISCRIFYLWLHVSIKKVLDWVHFRFRRFGFQRLDLWVKPEAS